MSEIDTSQPHHIFDYMEVDYVPSSGKKTQVFDANLVRGDSILPYYNDGQIIWMWKPSDQWINDSVQAQFENLVLTQGHPSTDYSHYDAIGMVRDVEQASPFMRGNVAVFNPSALSDIADGIIQLSPDAMVSMRYIGREINGQWVDYAQDSPMLDHLGLVRSGRAGSDLSLRRIADSGEDLLKRGWIELTPEAARQKEEFIVSISDQKTDTNNAMPKTIQELEAELATANEKIGSNAAEYKRVSDERDALQTALTEANEKITKFEAVDSAAEATKIATEAVTLLDASRQAGVKEVEIADCIKEPIAVYKKIADELAPGFSAQISDAQLPSFCAGLLAVHTKKQEAQQQVSDGETVEGSANPPATPPATDPAQQQQQHVSDQSSILSNVIVQNAPTQQQQQQQQQGVPTTVPTTYTPPANPLAGFADKDRIFK